MEIITACAKIIKVFSNKIIIICAESLCANTPEEMKCLGNFNPSEMSKTFIFVKKNVFLFVLFTMIVKNVVPLFSFSSTYFYFCLKK